LLILNGVTYFLSGMKMAMASNTIIDSGSSHKYRCRASTQNLL